jgi:hypothetical protein
MGYDKFEEFGDFGGVGRSNTNKDYGFPCAQRNGNDVGVAQEHLRHEMVRNEVPTIESESKNSRLDIGSSEDEGDEEGIGEQKSVKYLYFDSTWN